MIYPTIYSGPPARYGSTTTTKRYVAIHNTSNDASAEAEASYAKRRTDSVSSHYYVDPDSIVQSLDTKLQAWHAGSTTGNRHAIAYEITGVNAWTRTQWLARVAWPLLARQVAADCRVHSIVPRLLTAAQMQDGSTTGFVTHDLMRRAWGGTTHTDPGPNFPMDHLLALVRAELNGATVVDVALTSAQANQLAAVDRRMRALQRGEVAPYLIGWTADPADKETMWAAVQLALIKPLADVVGQMAEDVSAIKAAPPGQLTISDEQLERVIRKVFGGLDGATPAA